MNAHPKHLRPLAVNDVVPDIAEREQVEEALRESEERYRRLVELAPEAIAVHSEGKFVYINPAGMTLFGATSPVEIIGKQILDFVHPDYQEIVKARVRLIREESKQAEVLEEKLLRLDGRVIDAEVMGNAAVYQGKPAVQLIVKDITERKHAEEALRQAGEKYRSIFENAVEGIYQSTPDGRFIAANPALARMFGYDSPAELLTDRTNIERQHYVDPATRSEFKRLLEERGVVQGFEHQAYRKDGTKIWTVENMRAVRDASGALLYYEGTIEDITERKRAEEALRESEERYRILFESNPHPIWVYDLETLAFLAVNDAAIYHYGYSRGEFLAMTVMDICPPEDVPVLLDGISKIALGNDIVSAPWRHQKKDGAVILVEIASHALIFGGKSAELVLANDITERRAAQEALAQQAEREALINRISSAVRRSLDTTDVFHTAVEELGTHLAVDRCSLFVKDERAGLLHKVAEYHGRGVRPAARDFNLSQFGDLIAGIAQCGVLTFDDAARDERISDVYNRVLGHTDVRSIMFVAIKVGDEVPAAFALSTVNSTRQWREADIALARAVADQTGIAMRQAELYQKAEANSRRELLINRLSLAIRASLSLPEVLSTAAHELGRALSASRVHLRLYNPAQPRSAVSHEYAAPNVSSIKNADVSYDDPMGQRLLHSSHPIVIDDALGCSSGAAEFDAHVRSHAARAGIRSQIDCPLVVNGRFRGALCIHQADRLRHWSEDDISLVEAVAAQLATGIAQAELFEMVERAKKEWEVTFDAMSDGLFIFDNQGRLARVNFAGAALENARPQALLGRKCCEILRTAPQEQTCIVEKAIAEGQRVTIEVTPERLRRPLLVTVEPITGKGGEMVGAVCTARDLSELRKVEAVAREHQSLLTSILESVHDPICAIDTQGRLLWCNSATATLGYKPEALVGRRFLMIVHPPDRRMAKENLETALGGEAQSYELRYRTHDGEVRDALFYNAPLIIDGRTTGVLCIMRDITEHKQQRQRAAQADKLRALGQLASGVAHDFNNALAAILGRTQLVRRQVQSESVIRSLDIIQTAAEDAANTVRRIQTFARQSPVQEFELLDASGLLRDAVEITRTRWENEARMRGLHFDVVLDAPASLYTSGNASELREVFINLIFNAVDAMPDGGRLSISSAQRNNRLFLRFTDAGTGMSKEVREKIFEPFYTTKGANGTGLGLAVSYGIIERHGGTISAESEVGRGTTFEIELPVASLAPSQQTNLQEQSGTRSLSVLVVDDESFVCETFADMLSTLSHKVSTAQSVCEALERLAAQEFDLVFTDLSMPGMDGMELAREIRLRWPSVGIVLVTGHGLTAALSPKEMHLVDGVIGKPFDFAQIAQTIAKIK